MRRKQAFFPLLALMAALLGGCTLQPPQREQASSMRSIKEVADVGSSEYIGKVKVDEFNDEATGKDAPVTGGQIVVQMEVEPNSLNTWIDNDAHAAEIVGFIYDSLLRRDPETYKWEGSLAERWTEEDIVLLKDGSKLRGTFSEPHGADGDVALKTSLGNRSIPRQQVQEVRKGVSFTFYLRKGVRFHDGVPLTAADVKFSFDAMKDEYVDDPSLRNYYTDLKECEVLDDSTVRLTYSKQYWMAREFAGGFAILPKHLYDAGNLLEKDPQAFGKRFNESPYNRKPVGTGPYEFESWTTGIQVALKRNENYFNAPHRGHLDRIIYKFVSDEVAALQALKNGDINLLPRVTAEQFEHETNSPDFLKKFVKAEYYIVYFQWLGWNMRRPPFNDQRVRLAMAYGSFDRQEFLQKVLYGRGVVVTGSSYYFGPGYDHSIQPYPYDPEKARELLLQAGWYDRDGDGLRDKDGVPFRFELLMPAGREIVRQWAALMKENLRKLGIDMTVRELEWATFLQDLTDRKFDAVTLAWGGPVEDDPYQIWHSSQKDNRGSNYPGFGTPESDRIIEQSRVTLDDTARRKLFFDLHRIEHETQPYLFLFTPSWPGIYDKRYRGVKFYKGAGYDLTEWYLPEAAQNLTTWNRQ